MVRRSANCYGSIPATLTLALIAAISAQAGTLDIAVVDIDGQPVPGVAVYVSGTGTASPSTETAVMDQRDTRFEPHVLVVQKGTSVEFPNSDVVAHHVYSFSKPNNFVLPLYKGDAHNPIVFEHDGIVTLGCNIHDDMLAYIVVVDSENFGVTDANGKLGVSLDSSTSELTVNIWSPRIRDRKLTQVVSDVSAPVTFSLQKKLRPPHNADSAGVQWSEY